MSFFAVTIACAATLHAAADDDDIVSLRGATMGTTYSIKVAPSDDPPSDLPDDVALRVDAELRRVNDEMSTYLKSSEISRFNDSESTDWVTVSQDFAKVVDYAQSVSRATNGAFDITVGPLVDAWSFGPTPKTGQIPSDETLASIAKRIGYENLDVRLDPPSLKKSIPDLRIDLSAIAKGHGVDRVVDLLLANGAKNVFVEIGGEVRTTGSKPDGPWQVGIQDPAQRTSSPAIAKPLTGRAIATSGDYRNFFEVDGIRYSHTIDPRTGKPVRHGVASVSVVADSCMEADAWATAINVVGADKAIALASQQDIDVLIFDRVGEGFAVLGTGMFAADADNAESTLDAEKPAMLEQFIPLALVTLVFMGIVITGMAVGVMFGRKAIGGSCGGLANMKNDDGSTSCSLCSNPSDACKELRDKMEETTT